MVIKTFYQLFVHGWLSGHLELLWKLFFLHQHIFVSHFFVHPHFVKHCPVPINWGFAIARRNISLEATSSANKLLIANTKLRSCMKLFNYTIPCAQTVKVILLSKSNIMASIDLGSTLLQSRSRNFTRTGESMHASTCFYLKQVSSFRLLT